MAWMAKKSTRTLLAYVRRGRRFGEIDLMMVFNLVFCQYDGPPRTAPRSVTGRSSARVITAASSPSSNEKPELISGGAPRSTLEPHSTFASNSNPPIYLNRKL
jgi:hypothetical protein